MKNINIRNISCIMLILVISLLLSMHISLFLDESFSMGLIRHGYIDIVKIDALDVHPPLYYLLLKFFLSITTFWTKNLIIKIIFARVFSILLLIITFFILCKIVNVMKLHVHFVLLFLLIFVISLLFKDLTNIRMYSLSALFISVELLGVVQFIYTYKNKFIWIITISAILSSYTHDFSAVISGLFILILFIFYLYEHKIRISLKFLISGVSLLIAYMPWGLVAIKQTKNMPSNYWITLFNVVKSNIILIIMLSIVTIPLISCEIHIRFNNKFILLLMGSVNILFIIIELIFSFLLKPIFSIRYAYPLVLIYVLICSSLIADLRRYLYKFNKILISFLCLISLFVVCQNYVSQINYHKQSNYMVDSFNTNCIYIHLKNNRIIKDALPQFSIYAQYEHKYLRRNDYKRIINSKGLLKGTNKRLLRIIYYK